jgi:hypothetical protein
MNNSLRETYATFGTPIGRALRECVIKLENDLAKEGFQNTIPAHSNFTIFQNYYDVTIACLFAKERVIALTSRIAIMSLLSPNAMLTRSIVNRTNEKTWKLNN